MNKTGFTLLPLALLTLFAASCKHQFRTSVNSVTVRDAQGKEIRIADSSRIVSIGTPGTETLYALGAGPRIVGVDNSSSEYIPESSKLPKVGPRTAISVEGILSLKPTLVIFTADAGPPPVINQLESTGVTTLLLPTTSTVENVRQKVRAIATAVGMEQKGAELVKAIDAELADVDRDLARATSKPKVLFVGRGPNMPNATMSGAGTTVDEMIRVTGGVNPMSSFQGFKEMTDEAVIAASPDVILMTEKSFERSGGVDGVLKFPGVTLTPAGKNRRIVTISDMYFQGFGPGVWRAVRELALKLHPELVSSATAATH